MMLLLFCVFTYAISYLGKYGFSSNINGLMHTYQVSKSEIGLIGTSLFFAYGIGQFINGFLSKYYSSRWMIFIALLGSSLCNILVLFAPFTAIKFIWAANGFFCAILYPTIMKTLGNGLPNSMTTKGLIGMSISLVIGFLACYSLSALFSYLNLLQWYFVTAAIVMTLTAIAWVWLLPSQDYEDSESRENNGEAKKKMQLKHTYDVGMIIILLIMGFICLGSNLTKEGLISWSPSMFVELFDSPEFLAILLAVFLPVFSAANGILISIIAVKKPNFILLAFICSAMALMITVLLFFLFQTNLILTLILFVSAAFFMAMITHLGSMAMPLILKNSMPSGFVAGFMNGMCYLGSAIAVYLFGFIAENQGWKGVYALIVYVTLGVFLLAGLTLFIQHLRRQKKRV